MNGLLEDINYEEGDISAKDVFISLIRDDEAFDTIMGRHEIVPVTSKDGYFMETRTANFPYYDSGHYLFIEDGIPKGFIGIHKNNDDWFKKETLVINLIFVDKKYQKTGVGKRLVENLKQKAGYVDSLCKNRGQYLGQDLREFFFSICAFPNLFDYIEGEELNLQEVYDGTSMFDFTVHDYSDGGDDLGYFPADTNLRDETYTTGEFKPRISQEKLRDFYANQGFVAVDELQFKSMIENGYCKRELTVSPKTFVYMTKTPMVYPASNKELLKVVDKTMKKYINKPIDDKKHKEFTKEVIGNIKSALDKQKVA